MKHIVLIFSLFILGCSTSGNQDGGFYTWVDASGNVHTERRLEKKEPVVVEEEVPKKVLKGEYQQPKVMASVTPNEDHYFNPDDFQSSEEIDKQLAPKRLYSWQDQGAQITQELSSSEGAKDSQEGLVEISLLQDRLNYEYLAQDKIFYFNEVKGKELILKNIYLFNRQLGKDYILIELPREGVAERALFKSFIKKSKIALPNLVFLSERFDAISLPALPFSHHIAETWSAHGLMQGVVEIPSRTSYMLVLSNPNSGVLELGGENVKAINLGSILIDNY